MFSWLYKTKLDLIESLGNMASKSAPERSFYPKPPRKDYQQFNDRLESFIGWPVPWIDCKELAVNGFYYKPHPQYSDRVICAFCGITLCQWKAQDGVAQEHGIYSKRCPMVAKREIISKVATDLYTSYPIEN